VPPPCHLTSCTPTKSNLFFDSYFDTVTSEPALYKLLTFHVPSLMSLFRRLGCLSKESVRSRLMFMSRNRFIFVRKRVVSPTPNPQAGGPPLVICPWLLIQCNSQLTSIAGGSPSIRDPRTSHAVVTGTHLTWHSHRLFSKIGILASTKGSTE
jgi:hypothetical protein